MRGNFTDSNRATSHLVEINEEYKKQTDEYKKFAKARKENQIYIQEQLTGYYDKMMAYCENSEKITISGCILAMGVNQRAFSRMRNGEFDHQLERFCAENGYSEADFQYDQRGIPYVVHEGNVVMMIDYAEMIEKFMLLYQNQAEIQVLSGKPVGGIFTLKSQFGWDDKVTEKPVDNGQMVIASKERAEEVMRMLMD